MCVRKFLGFRDLLLTIKDETKLWKESRKRDREMAAAGSYTGPATELVELSSSTFKPDDKKSPNTGEKTD